MVVGKLASDTLLLDVREATGIADYFVICSGSTDRQIEAIAEAVVEELKKQNIRPLHTEGDAESGWVLLDYNDVIVHIFTPSVRKFYDLESFWSKAKTVLRID